MSVGSLRSIYPTDVMYLLSLCPSVSIRPSRSVAQRTWDVPHLDENNKAAALEIGKGLIVIRSLFPGAQPHKSVNSWAKHGRAQSRTSLPRCWVDVGPSLRIALLALPIPPALTMPLGPSNGLPGSTHETLLRSIGERNESVLLICITYVPIEHIFHG